MVKLVARLPGGPGGGADDTAAARAPPGVPRAPVPPPLCTWHVDDPSDGSPSKLLSVALVQLWLGGRCAQDSVVNDSCSVDGIP